MLRSRLFIALSVSFISAFTAAPFAIADPTAPRMEAILGGSFLSAYKTPMAIVAGDKAYCSGLLVGPKIVLTAGHCVSDGTPIGNYRVVVAGNIYTADAATAHPSYQPNAEVTIQKAKYDIAYVHLTTAVTSVDPIPVLINQPLKVDEDIMVRAFGSNEKPDSAFEFIYEEAKTANLKVEEVYDGLIATTFTKSSAAMCSGDSGGAATINLYGRTVAVGVVSLGSTKLQDDGTCTQNGNSVSAYVDVQSTYVRDFVMSAPGIVLAKANILNFSKRTSDIAPTIQQALKAKTVKSLNQKLARVKPVLKELNKLADSVRETKVKSALKILQTISRAKTLKDAITQTKKLSSLFSALMKLGIK